MELEALQKDEDESLAPWELEAVAAEETSLRFSEPFGVLFALPVEDKDP